MSDLPLNRDLTADYNVGPRDALTPSKAALWTGRVLSILPALMIGMGGVMDLFKPQFVVEGVTRAGYPESIIVPLGVVVTLSAVLFLIPQTLLLGALLITAYLGGAVATHVRMAEFGQMIAPVGFAVVMWVGLLLREPRLRSLLPLRKL